MRNILRVVVLGVVGFSLLVYLTLPKNILDDKKNSENKELSVELLPKSFDIVGKNPYTKKEDLFSKSEEKFIIVLNHDSLAVFKDFYKKIPKTNIILVANISDTPWLIKQMVVDGELEKMYKESKLLLINDSNGSLVNALALKDSKQNRYFVYKLSSNGSIKQIFKGSVKEGAMQDGISADEIDKSLNEVVNIFE